jgi:transglutaminase/protease-like cytokinesis protein 3
VCSDYSNLFYELCTCVGIQCYRVAGEIRFSSNNMGVGFHQWNLVRIGNKYYYIDPTNDDKITNSGVGYSRHYFGSRLNRIFYSGDAYLIY